MELILNPLNNDLRDKFCSAKHARCDPKLQFGREISSGVPTWVFITNEIFSCQASTTHPFQTKDKTRLVGSFLQLQLFISLVLISLPFKIQILKVKTKIC
jgi:hypothetical protein